LRAQAGDISAQDAGGFHDPPFAVRMAYRQ